MAEREGLVLLEKSLRDHPADAPSSLRSVEPSGSHLSSLAATSATSS
jgi:hypothetical protein